MAHRVVLLLIFATLGIRTALSFSLDWDFLAYHLPFSLMHYDLTTFQPGPSLLEAYRGFPPLIHIVQGAFIRATGIMSMGSMANVVILAILIFCSYFLLGFPIRWFLTFILAVPMVVIHFASHYIDFWVGCTVSIVFLAGVKILESGLSGKVFAALLIGAFGGMFGKYQAWPFIVIIAATITVYCLKTERIHFFRKKTWLWLCIIWIVIAAYPARNILKYGNPTYPVPVPLIHVLFPSSPSAFSNAQMPEYLWNASRPREFIESAFELNRFRADGFHYSIDQGYIEGPASPHFRMGGWFLPTIVGMCIALMIIYWSVTTSRRSILLLSSLVAMLMFIPQNHEMRYWLFVPLCGLFLVAKSLPSLNKTIQTLFKGYFILCAIYVFSITLSLYKMPLVTQEQMAPAAAKAYWNQHTGSKKKDEYECLSVPPPWGIFWAGPDFNQFNVKYCQ